jgi:hypothetical protein
LKLKLIFEIEIAIDFLNKSMLIIIDLKLILTELSFFQDELLHPIFFCNFDKNKVMSTQELKLNLLDKLASVTDENLLNQIQILIDNSNKNQISNWETLSKTQQNGLLDAIDEMDNSAGIIHKSVIEKYKKKYA